MDDVIMDAIPFTIKQSHCPNPACQALTQTPSRSFDTSSGMIVPYLLKGEKVPYYKKMQNYLKWKVA